MPIQATWIVDRYALGTRNNQALPASIVFQDPNSVLPDESHSQNRERLAAKLRLCCVYLAASEVSETRHVVFKTHAIVQ